MKRRFKLQSLTSPILEWKYMCVCVCVPLADSDLKTHSIVLVCVRAGWSWQTNEGVEIWRTPILWPMLLRYHRNPHLVELGDNVLKWRQTKGAEIRREMRLRFCAAQTYFWYSMLYRSAANGGSAKQLLEGKVGSGFCLVTQWHIYGLRMNDSATPNLYGTAWISPVLLNVCVCWPTRKKPRWKCSFGICIFNICLFFFFNTKLV